MEARVDVRARFGHREAAPSGEADGRPVRAAQLGVRSMNFGQYWRTPDTRTVPYDVTLPLTFVISVLGRELPEYTRDCLAHPGTDPFEDALRNRQWPGAEAVLDDAELCSLALG